MDLYRLAICEDNDTIRVQLHSLCHEILTEADVEHSITDFSSAQELENLLAAENNPFTLLLLDIQTEGLIDMELAQSLRQHSGGKIDFLPVQRHGQFQAGSLEQQVSYCPVHPANQPQSGRFRLAPT